MSTFAKPRIASLIKKEQDVDPMKMDAKVRSKMKKKAENFSAKPPGRSPTKAMPSAADSGSSASLVNRAGSHRSTTNRIPLGEPKSSTRRLTSSKAPQGYGRSSAHSTRSALSSARSGISVGSTGTLGSRLDDFSDLEEENEGQEVKFVNIPSLREETSGTAKDAAQPKQFWTISSDAILKESQESEFKSVYDINLHAKSIKVIENLEKFLRVRVLDLSCNYIEHIDKLDANQDLREVKLYDNCITHISGLDKLKTLSTLQLQHNKIGSLGKGLQTLRLLKVLRLDNNVLTRLDVREMASLGQLSSLDISSNRLDNITAVNCLPSLEELYCRNNRLRSIPDISRCKKLQEVDFSYNKLSNVSGLKSLPHLSIINVSHNQLTSLKSLGKLKGLEELFASHNRLTEVGCVVDFYPSLQILDVSENHIEHWTEMQSLRGFAELVELFVAGNPFSLEGGEKPHYIPEIMDLLSQIHVLDGSMLKKSQTRGSTPLMRPMSASSIVSSRQVETQINAMKTELAGFEESLSKRFESLRDSMSSLPDHPPSAQNTARSARPSSKCSKRSLIQMAQQFAASHFDEEERPDLYSPDL